jgi:ribonuclease PH
MNLVMTSKGEMVEVQATGEGGTLSRADLDALLSLGEAGIAELRMLQLGALGEAARRLGVAP